MKEMVTLSKKEQKRLMVLNQVEVSKMIGREAAEVLGLSLRHMRRLLAAYRKEGAVVLATWQPRKEASPCPWTRV
jgi:transposase